MRQIVKIIAAAAVLAAVAPSASAQEIRVAAAASLADVLPKVGEAFTAKSGIRIVPVFAGSSALARQIEQRAPFDLFISADLEWMDFLDGKKLLMPGTRRNILGNSLVLIAPLPGPAAAALDELPRLLGDGRLAVADTEAVPAGRYAKAALQSLKLWEALRAKLAPAANVRAALAFVARGEAPYGIVYRTDAAAEPRVRVVAAVPQSSYPPITYAAALMAASDRIALARQFLDFLVDAEAGGIFAKFGFSRPEQ